MEQAGDEESLHVPSVATHEPARREPELAVFRRIFEKIPLGLLLYRVESDTDPGQLRIVLANEHAGIAAGVDMTQFIGKTLREAFSAYLDTGQPQQILDGVWHHKKTIDLGKIHYADGNVQRGVYQVGAFPAHGPYICVAYSNITEQQVLQARIDAKAAALELANNALERSNASLEQFAYIASHDLQEPLRKIRAFGDRIQSGMGDRLDQRYSDYLSRMVNAAGRMSALVSDLLMYSRVQSRTPSVGPVGLRDVLAIVIEDLEVSIADTRARVTVDVDHLRVLGDRTHLRQLFQNLLSNALKFRREEVAPEVAVGARAADGHVVITVRDNGIGFEPKYAERILRPFQRLHSRSEYPGTGIGLAICSEIVARDGGELSVESEPGRGSTFTVRLKEAR